MLALASTVPQVWRPLCGATLLGLAVTLRATAVLAGISCYPIVQDTRIDSRYTTENYGGENSVKIIKNSLDRDGSMVRGLIALPELPALVAADIYSAKIWLCETWYSGPSDEAPYTRGITLYPLTQGFDENTATWQNTGGGQYDAAHPVPWNPAADIQEQANGEWWCSWDIKPLWDNSNLRNHGAVLILDREPTPPSSFWTTKAFVSSEHPTTQYRPLVEVVQTDEWKDVSGNWTAPGNWTTGTAPNVMDAAAGFLDNATQDRIVTVNSQVTAGALLFDNAAHKYTLSGSGANQIIIRDRSGDGGAITVNHGSHEISAPLQLDGNTTVTVVNDGDALTLSGPLNGPSSTADTRLTKAGGGTLILSGENAYTGGTEVAGGVLRIAGAQALPPGGSLSIGGGCRVVLDGGLTIAVQPAGDSAEAGRAPVEWASRSAVPEPGTLVLLAAGAAVSAAWLGRRHATPIRNLMAANVCDFNRAWLPRPAQGRRLALVDHSRYHSPKHHGAFVS